MIYHVYKIPMFKALKKVMEYKKHTFRVISEQYSSQTISVKQGDRVIVNSMLLSPRHSQLKYGSTGRWFALLHFSFDLDYN
jgi:hypothetical protein